MTIDQDVIMAEMVGGPRHRARTFSAGRVCADPGCTVVLSIYNSHDRCARHDFDPNLSRTNVQASHATGDGSAPLDYRRHAHAA